jgi:glutamate-1-semialdehyde 2,1-aminomutase
MEASSLTDARSAALYARAQAVLPGGVNSPVRAMHAIGRDPIFVERAEGAELTDVDGNRYVDWVCSWGPLVHGHAHPEVLAAVRDAADHGTTFGAPTAGEVELAEEVARRVPSVQMLRMTSSGTEAAMSAIRLARAVTGREKLLKFAGAYHGHVDGLLAQAGSGLATQALPATPGVPQAATAGTVIVGWNDPDAVRAALAEHRFAAVLAEPYPANMGLVPPEAGFLELLREGATANGALLVFDEVITGFRVAPGGAQDLTGVTPDVTVMGKVIGGGLPAAAFGGRREHLERLAPAGDVYQAGTLSGNPLAVAAGLTTLRLLDEQAHLRLSATTEALADGLREAAAAAGRPVQVTTAPGLLTVFFSAGRVRDYAGAQACDLEGYGAWCRALLARGVYPPPSQFEAWFPSLAHTPEHVERTVEAAAAAFAEVAV